MDDGKAINRIATYATRGCATFKGATDHKVIKARRRELCIAKGAKDEEKDFERRAPTREGEEGGKRLPCYGIPCEGPPAYRRRRRL